MTSQRERGRGRIYTRPGSKHLWAAFYVDGEQVRKSTGTADEKEAIRFLNAELRKVDAHKIGARKYVHAKHGRFSAFAELWQRDVLSQKKFSTQQTEASRLRVHLLPAFGHLQVKNIGPAAVQAFIAKGKHPKTIKNCIALLRTIWKTARAWGYASGDWFDGIELPEYQRPEAPHFTLEEMQRIIATAKGTFKTFYWLAAETGMRLGELCALHVGALDLKVGVIVVRHSSWHGHVGSTKSKRPRTFRLSPGLVTNLQQQIKPVARNSDAFVFRTKNGTSWIGDDVVKDNLKPLLLRLKIKTVEDGKDEEGQPTFRVAHRVGLHAFRHGNATLMDAEHTPLKIRQDRLGHVDGEELTLGVYTHCESDDHRAAATRLGELLVPSEPLATMEPASSRAM